MVDNKLCIIQFRDPVQAMARYLHSAEIESRVKYIAGSNLTKLLQKSKFEKAEACILFTDKNSVN